MHEADSLSTRRAAAPPGEGERESRSAEAKSIHPLEDHLAFQEEMEKKGAKIVPLAVATARYRDGLIDEVLTRWKRERGRPDVKKCPDCGGRGMRYRDITNPDAGVERCTHAALYEVES